MDRMDADETIRDESDDDEWLDFLTPAAEPSSRYPLETIPSVEAAAQLTREMEAVASQARDLLANVAGRVRLDLHATQGWVELYDMLLSDRLTNSLSAEALDRLRRCYVRWQHLHRHLRFVTSTRPVWNS